MIPRLIKKRRLVVTTAGGGFTMAVPRGPTPTKIVYEIPNPMVILPRFQFKIPKIPVVQDGYVIMRAQRGRCEEIEGGDIRKFTRLMGFIRRTRFRIPRQDSRFHLRFQAKYTRFQLVSDPLGCAGFKRKPSKKQHLNAGSAKLKN